MQFSVATLVMEGTTTMTQSHQHDVPKLEGESPGAYDIRTWRFKLNLSADKTSIVIPAHGLHQCIASAARYSKRQIPAQGKATWTAKFMSGIMVYGDPELGIHPDSVDCVVISANADGVRGSGKRVPRRFPQISPGWVAKAEIHILDPIITEQVFREMVDLAGMFIGLGQFRPEKGGTNGRFRIKSMQWEDTRQIAA